jgi:hypothetical protein
MKESKLVLMAGIVLALNMGFISEEGIYKGKSFRQIILLNNYEKDTRNNHPSEKPNRYPEKFPALLRTYDFTRLYQNKVSKF